VKGKKQLVCNLKNSLCGLKQSTRMWYEQFDTYMLGISFAKIKIDHCVYLKLVGRRLVYLVLYVDYMFLIGNSEDVIQDIGAMNFILVMEIK